MKVDKLIIRQRPPYLLGLFCLIPLIGAFFGLALLLYGIFKYKDKWLIMIGAFGIIFTFVVYNLLFFNEFYGDGHKQGFATISQIQLTDLIKDVEFYKLENGQYPDSLQQLLQTNKVVVIDDATQLFLHRKNSNYNYQRLGDKYTLFSSGQDGIPYTKDDLYPQISTNDSSKIGFVKMP